MKLDDNRLYEMIAYEAFIRRASELGFPFMLKGSYVTRQYFPNPEMRTPADMDWVYMEKLEDPEAARSIFDEWAILVTELEYLDDFATYFSFTQNQFWRSIDYAMHDDFPTVNTDLTAFVKGKELDLYLDISFNLDIDYPAVPMEYTPIYGEPFIVPYSVPLSLQVSWKIHQTIVRPRFKDIFDLTYLVQHSSFNEEVLQQSMQALANECEKDGIKPFRIQAFFNNKLEKLFSVSIKEAWEDWRGTKSKLKQGTFSYYEYSGRHITDLDRLPYKLEEFLETYTQAMQKVGIDRNQLTEGPISKLIH